VRLTLSALGAVALVAAPLAGAARSPLALVKALATAGVTASQLPHGYRSPDVERYPITAGDKKHHAVGGVSISTNGGAGVVIYIVFSTPSAAQADFAHGNFGSATPKQAPNTVPKPNVEIDTSTSGTVGGRKVTFGITDIAFVHQNVLVQAATSSGTSTKHGDVAGAVGLAGFALAHLKSVS